MAQLFCDGFSLRNSLGPFLSSVRSSPEALTKDSFTMKSLHLMVHEDSMSSFFLPSKFFHFHTSKRTFHYLVTTVLKGKF